MTTETQVSPGTETQNPAPETETPEVVTQEATTEQAEPSEAAEADSPDKALARMERRINKRTADYHRERARAEQLAQQLESLNAKSGTTEQQQDSTQNADPVTLAKQIARVERFNETADKLVADGNKKHKDFTDALAALASEVGPFVTKGGLPSPFMEAVLEVADKPTELLYHLGKNPELAEDLAGLSPLKLAKQLDRIEREIADKAKPQNSTAPKPLAPIKGAASNSDLGPGLSDAEWMRRREAQIKERRGY